MSYYKLKKPWIFDGHVLTGKDERFGRGSIVKVLFRKDLPDIICFTGRRAKRLGCAIYDFRPEMVFEPVKKQGSRWVKSKGCDLLKRNSSKDIKFK